MRSRNSGSSPTLGTDDGLAALEHPPGDAFAGAVADRFRGLGQAEGGFDAEAPGAGVRQGDGAAHGAEGVREDLQDPGHGGADVLGGQGVAHVQEGGQEKGDRRGRAYDKIVCFLLFGNKFVKR